MLYLSLLCCLSVKAPAASPVPAWNCVYTTGTITIDGRVEEDAWRGAPVLSFFVPITHAPATTATEGRILWDDQHVYISFVAEDADLRAAETERDQPVYVDDVLEFFFQVQGEEHFYYNIEINALGTVFDARRAHPRQFDFQGLRHAVQLRGTLNDASDRDEGWSLEIAIPFADIVELGGRAPTVGDRWRFHLSRYDYDDRFEEGYELSSTAPLTRRSFHYRPDWQELVFTKDAEPVKRD